MNELSVGEILVTWLLFVFTFGFVISLVLGNPKRH